MKANEAKKNVFCHPRPHGSQKFVEIRGIRGASPAPISLGSTAGSFVSTGARDQSTHLRLSASLSVGGSIKVTDVYKDNVGTNALFMRHNKEQAAAFAGLPPSQRLSQDKSAGKPEPSADAFHSSFIGSTCSPQRAQSSCVHHLSFPPAWSKPAREPIRRH